MSSSDSRQLASLTIGRTDLDLSLEVRNAYDEVIATPNPERGASESAEPANRVIDTSSGTEFKLKVPHGLYVVRGTLGSDTEEVYVRVGGDVAISAPLPRQVSSAAYQGIASSREYYTNPAVVHSTQTTTNSLSLSGQSDSWLFLFVRAPDSESYKNSQTSLNQAVSSWQIVSAKGEAISLAEHCVIDTHGWLAFSASVPSGDYFLIDLDDQPRTTQITLFPEWQTQIFVTFEDRLIHSSLRLYFSRISRGFEPNDDWARATDLGLSVLTSGRGAVPAEMRNIMSGMLADKFANPMLGLVAAWLVLCDSSSNRKLSEQVLWNLNSLLPGSADVAVLQVVYDLKQNKKPPTTTIKGIPLLQNANRELIRLAAEYPKLVPENSRLHEISARLFSDSAFSSWSPVESDLKEISEAEIEPKLFDQLKRVGRYSSPFTVQVLQSKWDGVADQVESAGDEVPIETDEDPGSWLVEAIGDVIEGQAKRNVRSKRDAGLDLGSLAVRTGVTQVAVRKALSDFPLKTEFQIALSVSNDTVAGGIDKEQVQSVTDAIVFLGRTLVSAGTSLAYGGDLRSQGYTMVILEMLKAFNATGTRSEQYLHSYLGAPIDPDKVPDDMPLKLHHLVRSPEMASEALMPSDGLQDHHSALYFSDMRRVMERHTQARVVLGGSSEPRIKKNGDGYGGRYPGVVEEAWRTLQQGNPLYVWGGFGGAAAIVADLLEEKETPKRFQDDTWTELNYYQNTAAKIDNDPYREKLGLPRQMEDLANAIRELGIPRLQSDQDSLNWNGLTIRENKFLFRERDIESLTLLVLKGLLTVLQKSS